MITRSQACVTFGFTMAVLFSDKMSVDSLWSVISRSFTDNVGHVGSQQSAGGSDRSGERLNSDGVMQGVTLRHTRVYDARGLQEPKSVLWKTAKLFTMIPRDKTVSSLFGPGVRPRPVITYRGAESVITANKEAYIIKYIDNGYLLFVIDLQTGETKKRFKLLGERFSSLVVAGDLLFVGESTGSFYAFDRRDWKPKWEISKKGYDSYGNAPAVVDGVIYFGSAQINLESGGGIFGNRLKTKGSVHAVDALTGAQKWMFTIDGSPTPIAIADEVIYVGDDDRHLFAVNAKDGKEIWKYTSSDNIEAPAIMDGRAFFSDDGGNLYAVDLKNGKAIWKGAKRNKVATPLAAYNNLVYYGGEENSLYAVDAITGQEKWVYRTTKPCPGPVVANGVIYVACWDNALLAIDAESGQEKWKYKTPNRPLSSPTVGNGVIYYLDEEGVMYALGSA